jgi:predicted enzyme related to lactoylglutathione lyase
MNRDQLLSNPSEVGWSPTTLFGGIQMTPIVHFDIPAEDVEKMKAFYSGVFGWTFEEDKSSPDCWAIGFESVGQAGPMTGGLIPRSAPTQPIGCYFRVVSIDQSSAKITELGGTVFVPKTAVPDKGYYACCLDPENNYFVIWESDERAT